MPPIYLLIVIVGVIGNGMVVAVILLHKHMLNSTNVLIMGESGQAPIGERLARSARAGLALSDLLFLIACIPFTAIDYAMSSFPFPEWWCNVQNYLQVAPFHCRTQRTTSGSCSS